ncbi:MAG: hypothetical protein CUN49_00750 [Candidatus Thermofonsia Clade 1 bacterium]|jgi:hypothetical protein|uniref:Uncharacterized protein n=1 Tax=Candidatus Thermofonsia Clade 1 bacterium TaxID=2364210 RepID=A0A2M8PIJ8_9CHLR|nr:MAG: hypothetical protein CUN49_00750 [Candidatus Thermofonsia Clade 1 bacterium]RMF49855.1 MAG: hypothetical protein D6749_12140 [Chloroflexota bacterium]
MPYSLDLQDHVAFDIQATPVEILVPEALSFQWILNGKALAFVAANATRQVVDAWVAKQLELLKTWDPNRIAFALNSFAAPDCVVTPYARQRLNDLVRQTARITSRSCTIIMRSALGMPVVLMSNAINSAARRYMKSQNVVFYRHEDGIRWLQRRIAEGEYINQTSTENP